jgi:DNA-directed RNA polymerase subunit RPC12/RpoP
MPVRFRCAYCNQLMGISHRKVGTVVRCPKCSGQVVVPQVEETPNGPGDGQGAAPNLLEDPELELLLAGAAKEFPGAPAPKVKRKEPPQAVLEIDVEPIDIPPAPPPLPPPLPPTQPAMAPPAVATSFWMGVVPLPRWLVGGFAMAILFLLGLAFLIGFLLGKGAL